MRLTVRQREIGEPAQAAKPSCSSVSLSGRKPSDTAGVVGQEWWDERVDDVAQVISSRSGEEIISICPHTFTEIQNDRNT